MTRKPKLKKPDDFEMETISIPHEEISVDVAMHPEPKSEWRVVCFTDYLIKAKANKCIDNREQVKVALELIYIEYGIPVSKIEWRSELYFIVRMGEHEKP